MSEEKNFTQDEITRPDLPSSIAPKEGYKDPSLDPYIPLEQKPTLIRDILIEHFKEYLED